MNVFANQKKISRFSFFILDFSEFEIFIWYFRALGFDDFAGFEKMVLFLRDETFFWLAK